MKRSTPMKRTAFRAVAKPTERRAVTPQRKPARCKHCLAEFTPRNMGEKACSMRCAAALHTNKQRLPAPAPAAHKPPAAPKPKRRADYLADTQKAFNAYVRARDAGKRCICCGFPLPLDTSLFDCGHFRSVGSAPHLRFDERNAHGQLRDCNQAGAGRHTDYRVGLERRLGLETVEALEADQAARKWTRDELVALRRHYEKLLLALVG